MDMTDLEQRIQRLEDIEAIRSLQSRYQRCVDFHEWDALREIFTPDAPYWIDGRTLHFDIQQGGLGYDINNSKSKLSVWFNKVEIFSHSSYKPLNSFFLLENFTV